MCIIEANMNYSTLKEAYSIDSFEKKPKKKKVKHEEYEEEVEYPVTERIELIEKQNETRDYEKKMNAYKQDVDVEKVNSDVKDVIDVKGMKDVEPYYDEDIEKYLNISDFKEANAFIAPRKSDDSMKKEQPVIEVQKPVSCESSQVETTSPSSKQTPKDLFYANLINIGLFMLVGILIIFICDQITEIAISLGMKKVVYILEPYLQDIR